MKPPYTSRQGQFLAFIHHYGTLHGRPPAEAEMVQFFQVTPPSVHQMILTLERRGLIARTPGEARSIRLKLPPESVPRLPGTAARVKSPSPAPKIESQPSADVQIILASLGRIQIEALFANNDQNPINDSKFLPLLDLVIESIVRVGLNASAVKELRRYVCEIYHQFCQKTDPQSTFEANLARMFSHLPGPARMHWHRWI